MSTTTMSTTGCKGVKEDRLKTPFSDENATHIALKITAWKLLVPYIGLDEMDKEEILKETTLAEQKLKMMHIWMQKYKNGATYSQFIKGCEQAKRQDLVEAVLELVKEKTHQKNSEHARLDKAPTLPELYFFTGRSGKRYRVIDRIAPFWEEFAFALQFESYVTETIKKSCMFQVTDCCRTLVQKWLQGYPSSRGPVTWNTFLSAMEDVEDLTVFTADLRAEL